MVREWSMNGLWTSEQIAFIMKNCIFRNPGRVENKAWVYLIHTFENS